MPDSLGDKVRLIHIRDAIVEIRSYVENATYRQLEVIGEACGKISTELKIQYPDVSWREIVGLRNVLIHQYFGVDIRIVWHIVTQDLKVLNRSVVEALNKITSEEE